MAKYCGILLFILIGCHPLRKVNWPDRKSSLTGSRFYAEAASMGWAARDSFVTAEMQKGNAPVFLKKFVPIRTSITDSTTGRQLHATYYVSPDYLSVGTGADWARVCITPMAAQHIAGSLHCFLPTRKMVNDIYSAATVKLEPVPMYAYRDSTPTMWQHHLIIEGQRKGRSGLIAGIKKDVVISSIISRHEKPNRVAIYGWHKTDGKPIQPLYAGHVNWYVDYSHGIRLIYRKIKVKGKWIDYTALLQEKELRRLLCDETNCDFCGY
jgi:hypothetical protein